MGRMPASCLRGELLDQPSQYLAARRMTGPAASPQLLTLQG